jgi:Putative phage tail protein
MTSPYQNSVVGCIQTIPLDLPPNAALHIAAIPNWANYRWLIRSVKGVVSAGLTYIHEVDAAAAQNQGGAVYDSGWWQSLASGYAQGDLIAAADTNYHTWWTSRSLSVPDTRKGPVPAIPSSIPLGFGATGIQIISFVYFGPFDANNSNITFKTGDATGLHLESIDGGYYRDTVMGGIYRNSWQPPYGNSPNSPGFVSLEDIAKRITKRGGLDVADYEAADFSAISVAGYPIARQSNAADCLLPLLQTYFAYASEYDAQLHFKFYGADAAVTVDRADLIEGNDSNNGAIVSNLRNQSTEFPRRVVASYMDPSQNYTVVDTASERRAIDVIAIGDQSLQIPVVLDAGEAAKAADKALKVAYATLEGMLEYSTPFAGSDVYLSLAAGEPLLFQGKRYVTDELILGNGNIKLDTRYDRQSAYTSLVQAIAGNAPTTPSSPYSGPTTLVPMNLPSLRPQDTYGVYLAAASSDGRASWVGCTVQASFDGLVSWQTVTTITESATLGVMQLDEPVGGEPLTVLVNADLETATDDQLAANANAFALLHAAGAEVGQFKTATETTTAHEYELTNVTRGGLGTTEAPAATGEQFVMLDAVYFLPIDISFKGKTIYFRAVGFGEVAEDADVVSIIYSPDTTVIHDGGVVTP